MKIQVIFRTAAPCSGLINTRLQKPEEHGHFDLGLVWIILRTPLIKDLVEYLLTYFESFARL